MRNLVVPLLSVIVVALWVAAAVAGPKYFEAATLESFASMRLRGGGVRPTRSRSVKKRSDTMQRSSSEQLPDVYKVSKQRERLKATDGTGLRLSEIGSKRKVSWASVGS